MANFIWYALLSVAMALIVAGVAWYVRGFLNGTPPRIPSFFGPRPEPRLAVVDHANVDGRRRLILVRRDNVEHLIMTGGPVDVLIETGIEAPRRPAVEPEMTLESKGGVEQPALPAQPLFTRAPRTLGTVTASTTVGGAANSDGTTG